MDEDELRGMLAQLREDAIPLEEVVGRLKSMPFKDMDFAKLDVHRELRTGRPEVVFCEGKTPVQTGLIFAGLLEQHANVMGTRARPEDFQAVLAQARDAVWHEEARVITVTRRPKCMAKGEILLVAAGTADIPVAEEARVTAEFLGNRVTRIYDVGVAGIHRLLAYLEQICGASVIIAIAGMEGALPSVVGGLASCPVVAVPTSVGYGASLGGVAALLAMLNSCATGIGVVNIDNGFGAGVLASLINRR